jgi:hypothetical protein
MPDEKETIFWKDGIYGSDLIAEHRSHGPNSLRGMIERTEKQDYEVVGIAVRAGKVTLLLHEAHRRIRKLSKPPGKKDNSKLTRRNKLRKE